MGHGTKFVKAVSADKVIAKEIGGNPTTSLEAQGVKVEVVGKKRTLKDLGYA